MTNPEHLKNINALKRIEGQVRGIGRMIEDRKYCVDILTQISAVKGALARVEEDILRRHLHHCVSNAMISGTDDDKDRKIEEIINLMRHTRKGRTP